MNFQPSRLTRILQEGRDHRPGASDVAAPPNRPVTSREAELPHRRTRLSDLNSHLLCSIIGTCLSTTELRKLVPRFKELSREQASDVEIHHAAVELADEAGIGAKALHKALDDRHELAIKRFRQAKNETELLKLWQECLARGDIPGAYWAVMTHPETTSELRNAVFGEVHMLSHLVGAANRTDIRRLLALEQENGELKDKISRQQLRLQQMSSQHQQELRILAEKVAAERWNSGPSASQDANAMPSEIDTLKSALTAQERALAYQTRRRELAEQTLESQTESNQALDERLAQAIQLADALNAEVAALEIDLMRQLNTSAVESAANQFLRDRRIVYVGGRPASSQAIKSLVDSAGGELLLHDGGIEDRKGLLAAVLPSADFVLFPVNCVDHDSMSTLKRICERHQVPFHALRSASVASFSALIAQLAIEPPAQPAIGRNSHFCLKHG